MATLSPTADYDAIALQYNENSDYDLDNSTAKCRLFLEAARTFLRLGVRRTASASKGEEAELTPEIVAQAERRATTWFHARRVTDAGPVQYVPATDFRD